MIIVIIIFIIISLSSSSSSFVLLLLCHHCYIIIIIIIITILHIIIIVVITSVVLLLVTTSSSSSTLSCLRAADGDDLQTAVGVDKLPTGALIGIGLGVVVVLALAILLCWCCCTGYLYEFMGLGAWDGGRSSNRSGVAYTAGSVDSNLEKGSTTSSTMQLKNGINYEVGLPAAPDSLLIACVVQRSSLLLRTLTALLSRVFWSE